MSTLYDILGVAPDADSEAIAKAYRDKAKTEHPDKGGTAGGFSELSNAYAVLIDPTKRDKYDRTGEVDGPPLHDAAPLQIIGEYLQRALADEADPFAQDLVGHLIAAIEGELKGNPKVPDMVGLLTQIEKLKRSRDRCDKMLDKRFTGKSAQPIEGIVRWHKDQIERVIDNVTASIAMRERAIEILRDVNFRWEIRTPNDDAARSVRFVFERMMGGNG